MDGLFFNISKLLSNEDFRQEARGALFAFSRDRKLTLPQLVTSILSFTKGGINIEMNRLCKFVSNGMDTITTLSKSAFSQARMKLNVSAFLNLNRYLLNHFNENAHEKKSWKGFRPVAIDGSGISLPSSDDVKAYFGTCYNQSKILRATARTSIAYDICNNLVLDAQIAPYLVAETPLAREHLTHLDANLHLLIFDRQYPCLHLVKELNEKGFKYCFRIPSTWGKVCQSVEKDMETMLTFDKGTQYRRGKERLVLDKSITVRVVKIKLPTGEYEVLLTNLPHNFKRKDLAQLYHMRWGVEECYKRLKHVSQIEHFSGKTALAVQQDFHARIVTLNIAALVVSQAAQPKIDKQNKNKVLRHKQQINKTQAYACLRDYLYHLLFGSRWLELNKMIKQICNDKDIIRGDRSFERNHKRKKCSLFNNYKMP